ncbi:MAG: aldehyde dehydrogenase family protein [Myxococcota bacterium]|nr:aldehyde dehydrogenase family protein [Myxococcota bacterium]
MKDSTGRLLRKGDYIFGSYVKPEAVDGYINGVNPGDRGDALGRFPFAESSVEQAIGYAAVGYRTWRSVSINDRASAVHRFQEQLHEHQEALACLITREIGKPLWESRQEVMATIRSVDLLLDDGVHRLAPRIVDDAGARSDRIPRGIAAIFCPYNFPLLVAASHAASAVLSGNASIVKPSKFTPGVGQAHMDLWDRCKLPRGVINMIQGPGSVVGHRLATHPSVDVVVFTGSAATARSLARLTHTRPELPVVLQCGGKGTALVFSDADVDRAVYEVMVGAFLTAGQRHNSTGRVIVTDAVYEAFLPRLVQQTRNLHVGYGFEPGVFMGPLISENLRTRFRRFSRKLSGMGHSALLASEPPTGTGRGFYVRPSIIGMNWEDHNPVLDAEPPGPTLLVYRVSDWQEAVALHNQVDARIATSVFTDPDSPAMLDVKQRLRTGALNINRGTIGASLRLPSVGLGTSSNGVMGGINVLETLTHPRSQLTETRPFEGMPKLPGIRWDASGTAVGRLGTLPTHDEPTEVGDLSNYLELSE